MGALILPASGSVYIDANAVIYSVERIEPYRRTVPTATSLTGRHRTEAGPTGPLVRRQGWTRRRATSLRTGKGAPMHLAILSFSVLLLVIP